MIAEAEASEADRARMQSERRRQAESVRDEKSRAATRERCKSLAAFVREAWPVLEPVAKYVHGFHVDAICDHLQAVADGRINRLLINVPPGFSKSLLVSVFWPAWLWANGRRSVRYITTSFAADATTRDTRKMRDLILSDWFQALWPELKLVRKGDEAISNTDTGVRESSAFGSLTSRRADILIIDDPHSIKTAESEAQREDTTRLFREGALNRLNSQEGSAIVVIMQRLHERDISGIILALKMGYVHLCLPMEFEPDRRCKTKIGFVDPRTHKGELLDPVRFPRDVVERMKSDMGAHAYAGQYQQRPAPREGGMFKRRDFVIVDAVPSEARRRVRRWDLAASIVKGGYDPDWTVGVKMSTDGRKFYVEHVERFRETGASVRRAIKNIAAADGRACEIVIPQDPGQAGKDQAESIIAENAGYVIKAERETGAKDVRAEPLAAQVEAGNVCIVRGDWNADFLDELCLAEYTLVHTMRGVIPIQDVCVGDMVPTRAGWKRVLKACCTNPHAELYQVRFGEGQSLFCTSNHPIAVEGSSFKRAGDLMGGDRLLRFTEEQSSVSRSESQKNTFEGPSTERALSFTDMSGLRSAERYLTDSMSTILTTILRITQSITWNAFHPQSTLFDTGSGNSHEGRRQRNALSVARNTKQRRVLGRELVAENAGNEISIYEGIKLRTSGSALDVVSPSVLSLEKVISTARAIASRIRRASKNRGRDKRAEFVQHSLGRKTVGQYNFAADVAVSSLRTLPGRHRVYNLEIEDCHEFVADGVLVHNCNFPSAAHDDQFDATAGAFNALAGIQGPMRISVDELKKVAMAGRRRMR